VEKKDVAIPPDRHGDRLQIGPASSNLPADQDATGSNALEVERCGLLAGPGAPVHPDRRMEEWIASNVDLDSGKVTSVERGAWHRLIEGLPGPKRKAKAPRGEQSAVAAHDSWAHFQVAYRRGITVVRLIEKTLIREAQIRELACDLLDLIAAGNHRIVLNFQATERLASWVVVVVREAWRRCAAADGGALVICGLSPQLAPIFRIAGMSDGITLHETESAAIDGPWPAASGPRPLPVEILTALTMAADFPPIRGGAPSEATGAHEPAAPPRAPNFDDFMAGRVPKVETEVWLLVQLGSARGRAVRIRGPKYVIGRDPSCQLRFGSAMVSKFHAAIEQRENGVFVRDLGSTNGTIVAGRALRNSECQLQSGDRIQIGPVVATLAIGRGPTEVAGVDEMIAGWLKGDATVTRPDHREVRPAASPADSELPDAETHERIKYEVLQDVLVITPQVKELDDFEAIELLRGHFHALFEQDMPREVVVNFEYVRHLSAQLIGVLLAHHLRLDRTGGALRICQAHARIMAVLHQLRLTMLVECYPTLDEAVLSAWPAASKKTTTAY
jgi:anti-anti-sigma factor